MPALVASSAWVAAAVVPAAAAGVAGELAHTPIGVAVVVRALPPAAAGHLAEHVAKWWLPDAIEFVDEIPHGATGKISKKDLRDQFRDYKLEDA